MFSLKPVVVIGSLNMDLVMRVPRFPKGGETLKAGEFFATAGGKGANQAIACARLGSHVLMCGRVGRDAFGANLREGLQKEGIDTAYLWETKDAASGVAMILVEGNGQNRILLSGGANDALSPADMDHIALVIQNAALLVLQLEVPIATVQRVIDIAHAAQVPVLLNPAPACVLPDALWSSLAYLIPNESEAEFLAGFPVRDATSAFAAADLFREKGVKTVLITLGKQGVVVVSEEMRQHFPAQVVPVVDTTAAGDTFIGGFVSARGKGASLAEAVMFAQSASAVCIQRKGAQVAIPFAHELLRF